MIAKKPDLSLGVAVEKITFSIKNQETYVKIKTFYSANLKLAGQLGKGLMSFDGFFNEDKSTFLGSNSKLGTKILAFSKAEGLDMIKTFRTDFLNLSENEGCKEHLSISNVTAIYVTNTHEGIAVSSDLTNVFEQTVQMQQKSVPKVIIEKGILNVGGKTAASNIQIEGSIAADLKVKFLTIRIKLKDQSGSNFFKVLSESIQVDVETVIAFFIVNQLSRVTSSNLVSNIKTALIKDFPIGQVVNFVDTKEKATTKGGKYVIRVLSGLSKKLEDSNTSKETQNLVLAWVDKLSTKDPNFFEKVISLKKTMEKL